MGYNLVRGNAAHCLLTVIATSNGTTGLGSTGQIDMIIVASDGRRNEAAKQNYSRNVERSCGVMQATLRSDVELGFRHPS